MSVRIMSLVWQQAPYSGNVLLVFLALADWSNDDGVSWPSMPQIADKARIEKRSAQRIVRQLANEGMIKIEEGGGRQKPHRYHIQVGTVTNCHRLQKDDTDNAETVTLAPETVTFKTKTVTPASPDPLLDPPLKQPSIDPPYRGVDFLSALAAYDATAKKRKVKESPEQRRALFKKLERWGEDRATQALEDTVAHSWQGVFEPKETNGRIQPNGVRPLDAVERNAARYSENLEFISDLRRSGGRDHN